MKTVTHVSLWTVRGRTGLWRIVEFHEGGDVTLRKALEYKAWRKPVFLGETIRVRHSQCERVIDAGSE